MPEEILKKPNEEDMKLASGSTACEDMAVMVVSLALIECELQHREIVPEGGSYAVKLTGWVEVSGADT